MFVCGEYKIQDPAKRKISHVQDHPLSKCAGMFGFSSRDIPKILDWAEDVEKLANQRCRN